MTLLLVLLEINNNVDYLVYVKTQDILVQAKFIRCPSAEWKDGVRIKQNKYPETSFPELHNLRDPDIGSQAHPFPLVNPKKEYCSQL